MRKNRTKRLRKVGWARVSLVPGKCLFLKCLTGPAAVVPRFSCNLESVGDRGVKQPDVTLLVT